MLILKNFQPVDMTHLFEKTITWNEIGRLGKHNFSDEAKALQKECLKEEVNELRQAITTHDAVEMLDAMCDILFVAIYAEFLKEERAKNRRFFIVLGGWIAFVLGVIWWLTNESSL